MIAAKNAAMGIESPGVKGSAPGKGGSKEFSMPSMGAAKGSESGGKSSSMSSEMSMEL
jgi:hypothetical protein